MTNSHSARFDKKIVGKGPKSIIHIFHSKFQVKTIKFGNNILVPRAATLEMVSSILHLGIVDNSLGPENGSKCTKINKNYCDISTEN